MVGRAKIALMIILEERAPIKRGLKKPGRMNPAPTGWINLKTSQQRT